MKNIKEEIDQIQEVIYKGNPTNNFFLKYTEMGYIEYVDIVILMYSMKIEIQLWNSEDEERKWLEERNDYEDFRTFLMRKINDTLHAVTELKSILI